MKLTKLSVEIDKNTFQPQIWFEGYIGIEFSDKKSSDEVEKFYATLGKSLIDQIAEHKSKIGAALVTPDDCEN